MLPALIVLLMVHSPPSCQAAFFQRTLFAGEPVLLQQTTTRLRYSASNTQAADTMTMRKQKASDKRTRRKQRGLLQDEVDSITATQKITVKPMRDALWKHKTGLVSATRTIVSSKKNKSTTTTTSNSTGRGRSRKRTASYVTLQHYQNHFLTQLQAEYKAEEAQVLGRIHAALDDPIGLEVAGYAAYDMQAERRGNLFTDEVYRLSKAKDALGSLQPNHKFRRNDVIVLTQQPNGAGDFFSASPVLTHEHAAVATVEARILTMGPTYLDIAVHGGTFEAGFGAPAGNDRSGKGNKKLRLRVDKFVSNVPYQRMVAALSQLTTSPRAEKRPAAARTSGRAAKTNATAKTTGKGGGAPPVVMHMDNVLKEVILQTHNAVTDENPEACNMHDLAVQLSKPPMASSPKLARTVLEHWRSSGHSNNFCDLNAPQLAAVAAALTRRLTLIQGPPGTGKTVTAAAIAFGFVAQCKAVSPHTKVLCTAFSNVGADNLAERLLGTGGLKVVRVGKASAVAESLWNHTLDAAIDRDPAAQRSLQDAAKATARLSQTKTLREPTLRDAATSAVQAAIQESNIAATKALRDADVIVTTSIGAADPRLLAACGIIDKTTTDDNEDRDSAAAANRVNAPDGLPPLSLPFVIIDEACQSVEPASLIPIVSSNTCRSLVLLGDPCQLPPTVKSGEASSLSTSLMERLAATLPHPVVIPPADFIPKDVTYLNTLAVKQALSLVRSRSGGHCQQRSYRKLYSGSLLLSIQYRMHASIAALPSALFYDGLLATPAHQLHKRTFPRALHESYPCGGDFAMCVRVVNVSGSRDNERQGTPSKFTRTLYSSSADATSLLEQQTTYWNQAEAERVVALVKVLVSDPDDQPRSSIGIISPYTGQVALIKSLIAQDGALCDQLRKMPFPIEVNTVDGYQGRERDVILFSAVRSNRQDRIGFLHDWRRLNVSMTRAKSALLIVGDMDTLASANKHWDALRKWATASGCLVDDHDSPADGASR